MKLEINLHNLDKETLISIISQQQELLNSLGTTLVESTQIYDDAKILKHHIKKQFGNQKNLAEYLGVSQPIVSQWCRGKKIPDKHKQHIETVSRGHLSFNQGGQ